MAKTMRKKNLETQMLAGNSLNSFHNSKSEKNTTLATYNGVKNIFRLFTDRNIVCSLSL